MRAILTYHSIDPSESVISVSPTTFRRHMTWFADSGIPVRPLAALFDDPTEQDAVALTFDDGFQNFASEAWPVLRDHGFPATVFVVVERVGRVNDWNGDVGIAIPTLPLMDWGVLGRLAEAGMAVGSHSRTHSDLRSLEDSALVDEIEGSADRLAERLGQRPATFAYPYGRVDRRVGDAVRRAYRLACTTSLRPLRRRDRAHLLPRLDTYYFRHPEQLEAWGSVAFRGRLILRAGLRRLRRSFTEHGRHARRP